MRMLPVSVVLGSLVSALAAQTYVVDAANGPGTQFTDLPAAVAAAPDGATLIVRAGAYGPIDLDGKGLTIVGGPGVMLNSILAPAIQVKNLAAHQSFALRGAFMGWAFQSVQADFVNNAGRVLLQEFSYSNATSPFLASWGSPPPKGIRIVNCAQVLLHGCVVSANDAVDASGSRVDIEGCTLAGTGTITVVYHQPAFGGTPGLKLANSVVRIAASSVTGGPGPAPSLPPAVGVQMTGSSVFLGAGASLVAGAPINFGMPVSAISGTGTLVQDPQATIVALGGANTISGAVTAATRPWPSVTSSGGRVGTSAQASVRGATGELVLLCVSFPASPWTDPRVQGQLWLDNALLQVAALGVQGSGAPVAFSATLPNATALVGRPRAWQAVSWSAQYGMQASNASLFVLLP